MNTVIRSTGLIGDNNPKYSYTANEPGQANFIAIRAKEEGLRVFLRGHCVMMYSTKKIPELMKIINESINYLRMPEPVLCVENLVCRRERTVLGVMVQHSQTCYATELHFAELKYHEYKREIPHLHNYRIFSSTEDMLNYLAEVEKIIV